MNDQSLERIHQWFQAKNEDVTGLGTKQAEDFNRQMAAFPDVTPVQKFQAFENFKNDWNEHYVKKGYSSEQISKINAEFDNLADPRNQEGFLDQAYGLGQQFLAGWEKATGNWQAAFDPDWAKDNIKAAEEHRAKSGVNAQISTYLQQRDQQVREAQGQSGFRATLGAYLDNPRAILGGFTEEVLPQLAMAAPAVAAVPFTGGASLAPIAGAVLGTQAAAMEAGAYRLAMKDKINGMSQSQLIALPEIRQRLAQGMNFEQAKADYATDFSDHAVGTVAAGAIGSLESLSGIGKFGLAKGALGAAKTFAKEPIIQGVQEGLAQINQNLGAMQIDPTHTLLEGVGSSVATGGLFGVPTGAVSAVSQLRTPPESQAQTNQTNADKLADDVQNIASDTGTQIALTAKETVNKDLLNQVLADYKTQVSPEQFETTLNELREDIEDGTIQERAQRNTTYGKLAQAYLQGVSSEQNFVNPQSATRSEQAIETENTASLIDETRLAQYSVEVDQLLKERREGKLSEKGALARYGEIASRFPEHHDLSQELYRREQEDQEQQLQQTAKSESDLASSEVEPKTQSDTQAQVTLDIRDDLDPVEYEELSHLPDFAHNHERIWKGGKQGKPFRSEQEAENSEVFKKAEAFCLNPTVVDKDGDFLVEMDKTDEVQFSRSAMKSVEANIARGRDAMTKAILEKTSVHRAMYNHELGGWVDFEYGDDGLTKPFNKKGEPVGKGISHIIEARMRKDNMRYQDVVKMLTHDIVETIAKGKIANHWVRNDGKSESVQIDYNGYRAGVIRNKGSNAWLLTAFELYPTDVNSAGSVDTEKTTHVKPTLTRQNVGAAGSDNVQQSPSQRNTQATEDQQTLSRLLGEKTARHIEVVDRNTVVPPKGETVESLREGGVEGWFDPKTQKLYLYSDNIEATDTLSREERLAWVAWHELAHKGVRIKFGPVLKNLLAAANKNSVVNVLARRIQADRAKSGEQLTREAATEEAMAELYAAAETDNWVEIENRYQMRIAPSWKQGKNNVRDFLTQIANLFRRLMGTVVRRDLTQTMTTRQVFGTLAGIRQGIQAIEKNQQEQTDSSDVNFSRRPKSESLEKLRNAETIRISGKDIEPSSDLREYKRNALNYGKTLRGTYVNKDTGRKIELGAGGVKEVLQHDYKNPDHLQSIAAIPQIIENAIYIDTLPNEDTKNPYIEEYEYYVAGLNIGGTDYTVKAAVGISQVGDRYYDHKLTQIEKGKLLEARHSDNKSGVPQQHFASKGELLSTAGITTPSFDNSSPSSEIDDKRLLQILQDENSSNEAGEVKFSRKQSALDLAKSGKAKAESDIWENIKNFSALEKAVSKVDEWVADGLRPVNDWIDQNLVGSGISEYEGAKLRNAMYAAKGVRDALNSDLEQAYLKPLLKHIATLSKTLSKKDKGYDELSVKRLVGLWASSRYAIERNQTYLDREYQAMVEAQAELDKAQQAGSLADIEAAETVYRRAEKQYRYRKQDVESQDFSQDRQYKVGVAGGWSTPLASEIMRNIESHIPRKELEAVTEILYDLNQKRLEIDLESGRYTQQQFEEYKKDRHYVPLTGDPRADEGFDFIAGVGSNAVNISKDKAAKGRTNSEAEDAIDAVWQAVGKTTTFAGWAEFKTELDNLYESEITRLQNEGLSVKSAKVQVEETLGISKQKMQGLTRSSDDVLIRKHGGTYYEYRIPAKAMNALKNDNVEYANAFLKLLSTPTSWYARGVTQWTLTFAPMNMLRDTWEKSEFIRVQKLFDANGNRIGDKTMDKIGRGVLRHAIFDVKHSKETWQAVKRFGLGQTLRDTVPSEKMLKDLLKNGGVSTYSTYLARTETDLIKQLKAENRPIGKILDKAGSVLESYNKIFDTVSALSAYKALRENGIDEKQAAATTLELTNFRKTGSKMRGIKALYMFSQPTAMGASNLIKLLATPKGRHRFTAYMAVMIPLYLALRAMDEEDEGGNLMDQLGDITRYIPLLLGEGKYLKTPVGFGMPQMAWNFSVNMVKAGVSDISVSEAAVNMLTHSLKTVAPISPSEISAAKYPMAKAAMTATPTILQPLMQIALDRTAFGSKLTTNFVREDKLKAEQSKSTTAQFWKEVAIEMNDVLGIDMHPEQIKNLFDGYGSMLGSLKELQTVFIENPNREALGRRTRVPFLNQFIGTTNEFAVQSRYYEASEEAQNVAKRYESQKERGNAPPLEAYDRKVLMFHQANQARMKQLNAEKAKLTKALRAKQMTPAVYEARLKIHNKNVDNAQRVFLKRWREINGLHTQ